MNLQLCFLQVISTQPNEAELRTVNRKITGHFDHFPSSKANHKADEGFWNRLVMYLYTRCSNKMKWQLLHS